MSNVLLGSLLLVIAWWIWRWVLMGTEAGLLLPWQVDSDYLIRYRPGTRWTWLVDPFGLFPGLWLLIGGVLLVWLWRQPHPWLWREPLLLLGWLLIAIATAAWYSGCAWGLMALPLG